jgi:HlyD family secretion protein
MLFRHGSGFSSNRKGPAVTFLLLGGIVLLLLASPLGRTLPLQVRNLSGSPDQELPDEADNDDKASHISGLGVVQPVGDVRTIFANDSRNAHAVVEDLFVDQGESIEKEEVIAYLKGFKKAQTMLVGLQQTMPSLETLVSLRRQELRRSQMLLREGAGTEEETRLREIDLQSTIRERQQLVAEISNAKQDLADLTVRAPVSGVVLKINTREGERISPDNGLMIIAPSSDIEIKAEIYENKAALISIGDQAEITSQYGSFEKTIAGRVTFVGDSVNHSSLRSVNPRQEIDARVVDVHILVDPSGQSSLRRLVGSTVVIQITKQHARND